MDIESYLNQISMIDDKIVNKKYERDKWYGKAQGGGSGTGERVQSSSDQQRMANAVAKYTDIDREIEELMQMQKRFINYIEHLPRTYYLIMHDIYVKGMTLTEVRRAYHKSSTWATTNHNRAKNSLRKILEGGDSVE